MIIARTGTKTPCMTLMQPLCPVVRLRTQLHLGERLHRLSCKPYKYPDVERRPVEATTSRSFLTVDKADVVPVTIAMLGFLSMGVWNRVTYKMALVPLKEYMFFIAQLMSFVYLMVYLPVLYFRYKSGIVTDDMLAVPKQPFVLIGACEAVASILLLVSVSRLPGVILPLLQQLIILWQVIVSSIVLRKKYSVLQLIGVALVVSGSAIASQAAVGASTGAGEASIFFLVIMNMALLLYALAAVIKEKIFKTSKELLNGQNLDLFVVNSYGSIANAIGVLLCFPLMLNLKNVAIAEVPKYLLETAQCFCGVELAYSVSLFVGAPIPMLSYIFCNVTFNIAALYLVRKMGAVITSIAASLIVPMTVAVFTLPLPFLGAGTRLNLKFVLGSATLVIGMLIYSSHNVLLSKKGNIKSA